MTTIAMRGQPAKLMMSPTINGMSAGGVTSMRTPAPRSVSNKAAEKVNSILVSMGALRGLVVVVIASVTRAGRPPLQGGAA